MAPSSVAYLMQNSTIVLFLHLVSISQFSIKPPNVRSRQAVAGGRVLQKGEQTKQAIVDAALGLAAQIGLEGLSIGVLAEVTQMSKSGVFAHFGSREELQISVIREYYARFAEEVFSPAMSEARGLPRVQALFANWMKRVAIELQCGCIFISGAVEFDDRPGPVRDALVSSVKTWLEAMYRAVVQAKEEGQLDANADEQQMAFEIHGLILALHYEERFLKNPDAIAHANKGFQNILARYGKTAGPASPLSEKSNQRSKE